MNNTAILETLTKQYPNSKIVCLPSENPTEIICETKPTQLHPEWSEAIAIIDRSAPHFHKVMTEEYSVIDGELTVSVDGKLTHLKAGDSIIIQPNQIHFAYGKEVWINVISRPGWTPHDHILI